MEQHTHDETCLGAICKMLLSLIFTVVLAIGLTFSPTSAHAWWDDTPSTSDGEVTEQLERLLQQGNRAVGMPNITNFFEKRMVKMLYEMRDNPEYRTYSYIVTMNGEFVKLCDSIGFGINASIQYSNPDRVVNTRNMTGAAGPDALTMSQMEPNGLAMPEGLAATYVMCLNGDTEEVQPVYVEPEVIVSPFPLN